MQFNLNRLKAERIAKGLTQSEMAEKLGFESDSSYTKIENGNNKLSMDLFVRILNVLGYKNEEILIFFN